MENALSLSSKLLFFKAEKYIYSQKHIVDMRSCPRPHFCIGLVLQGNACFESGIDGETVQVSPGELIFVPISSTYVSTWAGNPRAEYISIHFIFDSSDLFSQKANFKLQKITLPDSFPTEEIFQDMLLRYGEEGENRLEVLGEFYRFLARIFPKLQRYSTEHTDKRMLKAVRYVEENYPLPLGVEDLASSCHMSVSRFYPAFKKSFHMTPVDYINHFRISRALILLLNSPGLSVEEISQTVGFSSSDYFRRIFKKITKKTPSAYREDSLEI